MIGLYAGLRREEILALQWDSAYLDTEAPLFDFGSRAWHTEHNRPIILTELKTKAAERNIPLPDRLADCLREAKTTSEYGSLIGMGEPLSYTQFKSCGSISLPEQQSLEYIIGMRTENVCSIPSIRFSEKKQHITGK